MVLALATTRTGLPIGYKLFSGNTAEVTTLVECAKQWQKELNIKDTIFVADRGMMSQSNIQYLEDSGFKYIVAFPLRKLSDKHKSKILSEEEYSARPLENELLWKKELNLYNHYSLSMIPKSGISAHKKTLFMLN